MNIEQPLASYVYMMKYIMTICIFGCKRKGWRMGFYIIRIKGKWTIEQPLASNIYDEEYK